MVMSMTERYIGLNLTDDEFYIADPSVLPKNKKWFEEKYLEYFGEKYPEDYFEQNIEDDWCDYLYENSMSGLEILNRLNEQDERIKGLEIGENEIILKQETTINQLIKEKEELKDGLQEFREYCNYLKSILEDNEIWYE